MSKIIEEGPTCFSKPSLEEKHISSKVQFKNTFVTGLTQNYSFSLHVVLRFSFERTYPGVHKNNNIKFTFFS